MNNIHRFERKPKSTSGYVWDELRDIWSAFSLIIFGAWFIFNLVLLYIHGSILIYEPSKLIVLSEAIALLGLIALGLDKLRSLWRKKKDKDIHTLDSPADSCLDD
jgi:hypothetical protein